MVLNLWVKNCNPFSRLQMIWQNDVFEHSNKHSRLVSLRTILFIRDSWLLVIVSNHSTTGVSPAQLFVGWSRLFVVRSVHICLDLLHPSFSDWVSSSQAKQKCRDTHVCSHDCQSVYACNYHRGSNWVPVTLVARHDLCRLLFNWMMVFCGIVMLTSGLNLQIVLKIVCPFLCQMHLTSQSVELPFVPNVTSVQPTVSTTESTVVDTAMSSSDTQPAPVESLSTPLRHAHARVHMYMYMVWVCSQVTVTPAIILRCSYTPPSQFITASCYSNLRKIHVKILMSRYFHRYGRPRKLRCQVSQLVFLFISWNNFYMLIKSWLFLVCTSFFSLMFYSIVSTYQQNIARTCNTAFDF